MILGMIWSVLLLAAYLAMPRLVANRKMPEIKSGYLILIVVALTVRLIPILVLPDKPNFDIQSYQLVSQTLLGGTDLYSNPETENRHPYLPFSMYWMATSYKIGELFQLPFTEVVKLVPVLADTAITLVIYASLLRSLAPGAALLGGLLYAFNPVPIFVSAYHGQFDALPALFILLSLYWLNRSALMAGGWLGLGILIKSWPVLALPSLLLGLHPWKKRLAFLVVAVMVPILGIFVYLSHTDADFATVLNKAVGYNWGVGSWGYTYFVQLLRTFQPAYKGLFNWFYPYGRYVTLVGLGLVWGFRARKETPKEGILTVLIAFLALTHAFSIQYLVWIVPFAVLNREDKWLRWYTLAAFLYMFITYNTIILEDHLSQILSGQQVKLYVMVPASIPVWLVTVGWLIKRLFKPDLLEKAPQGIEST